MTNPEGVVSKEAQPEAVVSFEGSEVTALAVFLRECRDNDRSGPAYYLLVDMHNKTLAALGRDPMPVNPIWKKEYEKYKEAQNAQINS